MKCAKSSSLQYCKCAAIAERYEVSNSPSCNINCEWNEYTCMTKSTRPVELIALSLSASCRAVRRPVVLCLKTESRVSSGITPSPGVDGSRCRGFGFSGDMSVYPSDREIKDEVMLDLYC